MCCCSRLRFKNFVALCGSSFRARCGSLALSLCIYLDITEVKIRNNTFLHLSFLEFFLDVSELRWFSDVDAWLGFSEFVDMHVTLFLVPLSLKELAPYWYYSVHLFVLNW